jgi:hypothetical protein
VTFWNPLILWQMELAGRTEECRVSGVRAGRLKSGARTHLDLNLDYQSASACRFSEC